MTDNVKHWIGVASREHVLIGVKGGFAMLNHGKLAPLQRLSPGDGFVYYSPKTAYPAGETLKAFTAIGRVGHDAPHQVEMRPGFAPYRRAMDWWDGTETPIAALIDRLVFTQANWGMLARRGLFQIIRDDFYAIRNAMCEGKTP